MSAPAGGLTWWHGIKLRLGEVGRGAQGVKWGGQLPRVLLLHGTADRCALVGNAQQFAETLRDAGAQARRTCACQGLARVDVVRARPAWVGSACCSAPQRDIEI